MIYTIGRRILRITPHLVFIPLWVLFLDRFAQILHIVYMTESNPNYFVILSITYMALTMHIISLIILFRDNGRPRWALALHILFPLFLIAIQLFIHGATGAFNGHWL